jgi:NADPH-dependent curcumin reductase CurA
MPSLPSREIRLKQRPVGEPTPADFELAQADAREPGAGEVQVRNLYMSVDPYMRGRMWDRPSYVPPFQIGEPLQGGAVGEVVASGDETLKPGDLVMSMWGWRESFTAPAATVQKVDPHGLPPSALLGVAGMPGLTAYAGLLRIGAMKEGDTVFVSAAAGAVGSVVSQIAKIKGGTVIGSAGGADKVAFLKEIGVDHAIDYRATPDLNAALAEAAPKGIDIYFENVGGAHLEAAINAARPFARFPMCGMISQYNATEPVPGPSNLIQIVGKSLRMEGFIVSNHFDMQPQFLRDMAEWIGSGRLKYRETVDEGVENAPGAFLKLFKGENFGKMLVKLA